MKVAFCFPGQGSQDVGMGRAFADASPEARTVFDEGSDAVGLDLARVSFEGPIEELTQTDIQQPALVATSLACLRAVEARGFRPDYVVGHSVGEYSALAAAGAIEDAEAVRLVRARGEAMAAAAAERPGGMAAILGLEDAVVEELCAGIGTVWPAIYNCPGQIVVSGVERAVEECCAVAERTGAKRAVRLRVSGAFHSPLVARAADLLRPTLDRVDFKTPRTAFMSTVTARLEDAQRYRSLLVEQLTAPVRFTQASRELVANGATTFVEVGPGNVLSGLVKRIDRSVRTINVNNLKTLEQAVEALG